MDRQVDRRVDRQAVPPGGGRRHLPARGDRTAQADPTAQRPGHHPSPRSLSSRADRRRPENGGSLHRSHPVLAATGVLALLPRWHHSSVAAREQGEHDHERADPCLTWPPRGSARLGRRRRRWSAIVASASPRSGCASRSGDRRRGRRPPAPAVSGPGASGLSSVPEERPGSPHPRGPVMARSTPRRLAIPSVHIDTDLLRLGLNLRHPAGPWKPLLAGWYTARRRRRAGPAIIAGHVDSWETGPALLHLGGARRGPRARHRTNNRSPSSRDSRRRTQVSFPTEVVFADTDRAALRLITWLAGTATPGVRSGLIVFARLVDPTTADAVSPRDSH